MSENILRLKTPDRDESSESSRELRGHFFEILQHSRVSALYQPIVDFKKQNIFGYESLIRGPSDSPLHNPVMLFDAARREGRLTDLDLLCRKTGIRGFKERRLGGKLFLNATPQGLLEPQHRSGLTLEFLHEIGLTPENVVIEITEQYPLTDFTFMDHALEHYREMGFEIAIDDLGAGYSGLRRWSELRPEYVKIDRHFIQNIHEDAIKQSFVRSIADIAKGLNCHVIAEGIETHEECQTLIEMGIGFGQGYYFSKPQVSPPYTVSSALFRVADRARNRNLLWQSRENIADLLHKAPCLHAHNTVEETYVLFAKDENLSAVTVVDEKQQPAGLVRRSKLYSTFSSQYGRALHGAKSVLTCMDRSFVMVEKHWNIEHVSSLITDNMKSQIEADFVIVDEGRYAGVGKVLGLLKKITELQIRNARYANPLTLLPGNVPIFEYLDQLIQDRQVFTVAYCDIDNFKPYNDVYGYGEGDKVIKLIAEILRSNVHPSIDFIGHVGGDDFIVVFSGDNWMERCRSILHDFEHQIPDLYSDEDILRGGILSHSREGDERFFPIMTLSIGAVIPNTTQSITHDDVANMASQAKHHAKAISGNSLFTERRVSS
jgi:diguanylate cyclase (GGDEF)-like protein